MAEQSNEMVKAIYTSLCNLLDKMKVPYRKVEEKSMVTIKYKGQDMEHELIIGVLAEQEAIIMTEKLPFDISPEKATDVACAVCCVNHKLLTAKYTYNMEKNLFCEMTQIFTGSLIGEEALQRMIRALVNAVEDYDDKFMALNKGYLKVEDFKN